MVNVAIPIFRARPTLPYCLNSLVAQTKNMFLVTLVQDGDNEDYSDIIEEYTRRGLKINLIKLDENKGPGNARQVAIDRSKMCDYIMFMDSDDMLMPRAVEILYREAKANNADIVSSHILREQTGAPGFVMDVNVTPVTWFHGKIYRIEYFKEKNIRFAPDIRLNEDSYFNLVACNCTERHFKVQEVTYLWRDYEGSLTRAVSHHDFFAKSWVQYIYSQVHGILDIIERMGTVQPGLLAATLINMYNHDMEALFYELDTEEDRELESLFHGNEIIKSAMQTKEFWDYIFMQLRPTMMVDDALIFHKIRFTDWLQDRIEG